MSNFPLPIEPKYNPSNLNSSRASTNWFAEQQTSDKSGGYITQSGTVVIVNADTSGSWKDADAGHPVPKDWLALYPTVPNPQYWAPSSPDLPNNLIYKYVTVWGRNGTDLYVLSDATKAALAIAQQTVVEPPSVFPPPTPVAPPSPPHPRIPTEFMDFVEEMWKRFRGYF